MKGLAQIVNRGSGAKNEVASVLLFTDGLANYGIFQVFFLVYIKVTAFGFLRYLC